MSRRLLLLYQLLTGLSDTSTGLLLILSPALTLHLMRLHVADLALPYLSWIGVFVLSVGLACLYGAWLTGNPLDDPKLEVVWLLTAIPRTLVTLFVVTKMVSGALEPGWFTVAVTDGTFALTQVVGLSRGWLRNA